ncbi:MAG: molybdopterin dehydrogenase [Thermoprotei archaeon]|nr:MAG: molybdopterin dehydrogenase [Thermoprotei archaeon]
MIPIQRFDVYRPISLNDALEVLRREGSGIRPIAGGTDVLVLMRDGKLGKVGKLLDLWPIRKELSYIKIEDGYVRVGALTTIDELCSSDLVSDRRYAGLMDACRGFGAPFLKNVATVGGNIGTSHPLSDFTVAFLTLDAEVKLVSGSGERYVPLKNFFTGFRTNVRRPDELIAEVRFREAPENSSTAFMKFDRRWAHAMGYILCGGFIEFEGSLIKDVRVAFDSVSNPYPERAFKTEEFLRGKEFSEELIREAYTRVLPTEMRRISDYRASAEYRLDLSKILMKRVLLKIRERVGGE